MPADGGNTTVEAQRFWLEQIYPIYYDAYIEESVYGDSTAMFTVLARIGGYTGGGATGVDGAAIMFDPDGVGAIHGIVALVGAGLAALGASAAGVVQFSRRTPLASSFSVFGSN